MNSQRYWGVLTLGSIGYMPAAGTWASLVSTPSVLVLRWVLNSYLYYGLCVIAFVGSYYLLLRKVDPIDTDPSEIVIDEVIGVMILYLLPVVSWYDIVLRFFLFRFFDITKIGIAFLEKIPGPLGILADDIGAALLGILVAQLIV